MAAELCAACCKVLKIFNAWGSLVLSPKPFSPEWRLSIGDYKCPPLKWSGVMPIPFLSRESPNLVIFNWHLIASQEVLIKYRRHQDYINSLFAKKKQQI